MKLLWGFNTFAQEGYIWEGDPEHAATVIKRAGVENGNSVSTPGVAPTAQEVSEVDENDDTELTGDQRNERDALKSKAMLATYLSLDRPETLVAVKELTRGTSAPTKRVVQTFKRLGR